MIWATLNLSGLIIFTAIIAPLLYGTVVSTKGFAELFALVIQGFLNILYLGFKWWYLKVKGFEMGSNYYNLVLAVLSIPCSMLLMFVPFWKKNINEFFKD